MKRKALKQSIGLIAGTAAFALLPQAQAAENPFGLAGSDTALVQVAEAGEKGISVLEGKCGAGKCGTKRVRQMMDRDADGKIDRGEYVSWVTSQAVKEFDGFADGKGAVDAHEVFEHFRSLEFQNQG